MMAEVRNAEYIANGYINCEWNHPERGWIPFTAADGTGDLLMQEVWDAALASDPTPYTPPTDAEIREEWRTTAVLSRLEFVLACKSAGILTTDEAITAAKGDWPASFADALANPDVSLDPDEAQIKWAAATEVDRMDPIVLGMQQHLDLSPEAVDALFGY